MDATTRPSSGRSVALAGLAAAALALLTGPAPADAQGAPRSGDAPAPAPAGGAGPTLRAPGAGPAVPADSVKAVVHAFHRALAAGDSARALELLHPEVRVYESGHAETLAEYRSGHLAADIAFSSAADRTVVSERVFGTGDVAVYLGETRTSGRFRGRVVDAGGTETMVLVRTDAGWRIRHIHWSSR